MNELTMRGSAHQPFACEADNKVGYKATNMFLIRPRNKFLRCNILRVVQFARN
jgi:hypothetical protein